MLLRTMMRTSARNGWSEFVPEPVLITDNVHCRLPRYACIQKVRHLHICQAVSLSSSVTLTRCTGTVNFHAYCMYQAKQVDHQEGCSFMHMVRDTQYTCVVL